MTPAEFRRQHPGLFFLDPRDPAALSTHLIQRGVLAPDEPVASAEPAGAGNMNCTVRAHTRSRTLIVKQARPWVEKYPQLEAPWDRALRETEFYQRIAENPAVAGAMPRLLHADPEARLLVLSDLGTRGDFTGLYRIGAFTADEINSLAAYLGALHALEMVSPRHPPLTNREMRALNHAHIFRIPLEPDNGLDLDRICPGLAQAARPLKEDAEFRSIAERLGRDVYLADGPCLLHGDFFPGSLVRTADDPAVIDPEFAFEGRPEFDLAVFTAHLLLARQPAGLLHQFLTTYPAPRASDLTLVRQLAGIEIMRRLIGYAQLPLPDDLAPREELLAQSRELVLRPDGPAARRILPATTS